MLDVLEDFMELRGIPYARLDGSTTRPRHTLDIKLVRVNHIVRYLYLPFTLSFIKRNRVRGCPTFVIRLLSAATYSLQSLFGL
jgi:predicted transcriptional regulator